MAKRVEVVGEGDELRQQQAEEMAQLNEDEGGEVFRAIDELRGTQGTTIVVVKLAPKEEAGYCDSIPVAEFSHDTIKERFGAGNYKVRVKGPKGWLPGGGTVLISPVGIKAKPAAVGGVGGDFVSYLEYMKQADESRRKESAERSSRLLELSIPMLGSVLAAFISRPQSNDTAALITALKPAAGPSLAELSQAMVNMKQLSAPAQSEKDPIDTILRVFEAAKDLSGDGGGSKGNTNWLDIVKELIHSGPEIIKPVMQNVQAAVNAQRQAQLAATQPAVIASAPIPNGVAPVVSPTPATTNTSPPSIVESVTNGDSNVDMYETYKPFLRPYVEKVLLWATEDRDPAMYAEVFIDELPRNIGQFITQEKALHYLNHEKWFEYITSKENNLTPHAAWLNEFRMELITLLSTTEEPDPNDAPEFPASIDDTGTAIES